MKPGFWRGDWLLGLAVVVAFTAANLAGDWIPSLERKAYDVAVQSTVRAPSDRIAIIAIDQASIESFGAAAFAAAAATTKVDIAL